MNSSSSFPVPPVGPASRGFHPADWAVFVGVVAVSLSIGVWHALTGGRQRSTREFLLADGRLKTFPAAVSMLVSFVSAVMVLGHPAEMYTRGTQLALRTVGYVLAIIVSNLTFVPLFYNLKVTTAFEYLERRFDSKAVKVVGSVSMIMGNICYMGLVMFTPSTALEAVTGFPFWASIIVCGVISTFYTAVGGMRAVVYTDLFQGAVMLLGMFAIVIKGTYNVGGIGNIWKVSNDGGRINFFNFNPDPTQRLSFWSLVFGSFVSSLSIFGTGQATLQRYCALSSLSRAKSSLYLNIPGLLVVNILATLAGLGVYAYYAVVGCDPLKAKYISHSNQIVPYFMIDVLNYPGFLGIFLAVLFSGALSSMSSCLNSVAAVTWEDLIKYFFKTLPEVKKACVTKFLVLSYGGLAIVISFLTSKLGVHVLQASLSFTGASMGPCLGMFILGAVFPWSNYKGAIGGCIIATSFSLWLSIGSMVTLPHRRSALPTTTENCLVNMTYRSAMLIDEKSPNANVSANSTLHLQETTPPSELSGLQNLYSISFLWYGAIGTLLSVIAGLVISFATGHQNPCDLDSNLIIPVLEHLCCCLPLPKKMQIKLQSGLATGKTRDKLILSNNSQDEKLDSAAVTPILESHFIEESSLEKQKHRISDMKSDIVISRL